MLAFALLINAPSCICGSCREPAQYGAEERQSGPERSVNLHAPLAILLEPLQELLPDHALLTSHALQHVLDACT